MFHRSKKPQEKSGVVVRKRFWDHCNDFFLNNRFICRAIISFDSNEIKCVVFPIWVLPEGMRKETISLVEGRKMEKFCGHDFIQRNTSVTSVWIYSLLNFCGLEWGVQNFVERFGESFFLKSSKEMSWKCDPNCVATNGVCIFLCISTAFRYLLLLGDPLITFSTSKRCWNKAGLMIYIFSFSVEIFWGIVLNRKGKQR